MHQCDETGKGKTVREKLIQENEAMKYGQKTTGKAEDKRVTGQKTKRDN